MYSLGINGEGELREQLANPGSSGKMAFQTECVCVRHWALDVESGNDESGMEHNSTCSLFSVIITLTDEGLDQLCPVHFIALILVVSVSMLCTVCQGNKSVARLLIHVGILS